MALFLKNADHGEELAVDGDFLADGVAGRLGEKSAHGVVAEEDDRGAMLGVGFVEEAAGFDFQVEDFADGRLIALQDDALGAVLAAANVFGAGAEHAVGKCASRRKRL